METKHKYIDLYSDTVVIRDMLDFINEESNKERPNDEKIIKEINNIKGQCDLALKDFTRLEIKLENKDILYAIKDINGGSTFLKYGEAFKKMLINDILEDTKDLAYFEAYESLGIAITRLNIVIMDIFDSKLSKMVIHIANEYGYEVYDVTKLEAN